MEQTTRSAFIMYTRTEQGIEILLGEGKNGLTTIGGRNQSSENHLACLVREIFEETRGLIDYRKFQDYFLTLKSFIHEKCFYSLMESDMKTMTDICEKFKSTFSTQDVCNELSAIVVVPIKSLIKSIITGKSVSMNKTFRSMFLDVGYDILSGNLCNHNSSNLSIQVKLTSPISEIPNYICLTPIKEGLPKVYGIIPLRSLYITDQFYLQEDNKRYFRTGVVQIL